VIEGDEPRDLAALVVPRAGRLEHAEDPWQPYRLCDPAGGVVAPVAAYLRELQARGRPETTLRAYAIALLRWFRFLWATGVPWDQATRAEARDFAAGSSKPSSPAALAAATAKTQAMRAGQPALTRAGAVAGPGCPTR
jgi:hypothetical protein